MAIVRWVSVGFESTFGTPVAGKYFIDPTRVSVESPSDPFLRYGGAAGRGNRAIVPGMYIPGGDIETVLDPWHAGCLLRALVPEVNTQQQAADKSGAVTTTLASDELEGQTVLSVVIADSFTADDIIQIGPDFGGAELHKVVSVDAGTDEITIETPLTRLHVSGQTVVKIDSAPYEHVIDIGGDVETLDPVTIRVAKDFDEQIFQGANINQITLNVDHNSLFNLTANIIASKDGAGAVTALPNSGDPLELVTTPYAGPMLTVAKLDDPSNGEKDIISHIRSVEFTFNNNIGGEDGMRMGSRFPTEFQGRQLDVTARMTLVFRTRDQYEDFWGNATTPQETIGQERDLLFKWDLNANETVDIRLFNAYLITPVSEVSGRDMLVQTLEWEAIQKGPTGVPGVMAAFRYMSMKNHRYF